MFTQTMKQELDDFLIQICTDASGIILKHKFNNTLQTKEKISNHKEYDEVTLADLETQEFLITQIKSKYQDSQIIAEEGELSITNNQGLIFSIDPIDGTKEYVRGGNEASIMIAVLYDGVSVASIVYNPFTTEYVQYQASDNQVIRHRAGHKEVVKFQEPQESAKGLILISITDIRNASLKEVNLDKWSVVLVNSGSYGSIVAKMITNQVSGILLKPTTVHPWDSLPMAIMLNALGYKKYEYNSEFKNWIKDEIDIRTSKIKIPVTILMHPNVADSVLK